MDSETDADTSVEEHIDGTTLERLHRATNQLYAADTIEECGDQTTAAAIDILGFDWCVLVKADEEAGMFEITATEGDTALEIGERPLAIDEGLAGDVFERGEPEVVNDVTTSKQARPLDRRIQSGVVIPVGEWGVFQALGTDSDLFEESDIRLLELLVNPLATTIERIQREKALRRQKEELARQNRQIEAIHAVSTAMKVTSEKQDIYDLFVETVEQVLDITICSLDECDGRVLKTRAVGSQMEFEDFYTETPLDQPDSLAAETYHSGETTIIDDLTQTDYRTAASEYRSLISVPLGEWGVFQAATPEESAFEKTDRQLIELLADAADAAIDRIERGNELKRRADELETQNDRLDQFASRLSHEMRNPLSVLQTRTTLARESGNDEHFEHIERSIYRMKRLINDTLMLAREGTVEIRPESVALDALSREYWDSIRTPNTGLRIETEAQIHADEDRLHQLLSNLFRNAVEHTGNGVTVTVGDLDDGFYVEDDGPGIAPEDRDSVLASGTSGMAHGTGLGLAVVSRIAEAHGWSLTITDSSDGGARFEFHGVEHSRDAQNDG